MSNPDQSYPFPIVPAHMTKLTIERLPFDQPFFVETEYTRDFDDPTFFVNENGRLAFNRSHTFDIDDENPSFPMGRIGIMRSFLIDDINPREVYLADMRFAGEYELDSWEDVLRSAANNQEEYMRLLGLSENSVAFDGLIASEAGADYEENDIPEGLLYGESSLHSALATLRVRGNAIVNTYFAQERIANEKQQKQKRKDKKHKATKS